jgi:hypothetical protein
MRTLTPFNALVRRLKDLLALEMRMAGTADELMPPMVPNAHETLMTCR